MTRPPWKRRYVPERANPKVGEAGSFVADLLRERRLAEAALRAASDPDEVARLRKKISELHVFGGKDA